MEKARLYSTISGLVQGVGYRFFCQRNAYRLNITGYAKNLWDGKVEIVAEGEKDKLLQFVDLLKQGPMLSDVKKVDIIWEEYKGEFSNFSVK